MKAHSPQFIDEMKQQLLTEKSRLEADLGATTHSEQGNLVADFPDYGRNEEDNATEIADYSATSAAKEEKEARLRELEAALSRIEAGGYGLADTGQLIPEARLRANPAATTLVT